MEQEIKETHDSYGMVSFSRMHSSHDKQMFGSKIGHNTIIKLEIHEAAQSDCFGTKRVSAESKIIDVQLSPNQFSELLTTMNIGNGVPCTINWRKDKGKIEPTEQENPRKVSERYLEHTMQKVADRMDAVDSLAKKIESAQSAKKSDRKELLSLLRMLRQDLEKDMPFVEKTFQEVMDKTVSEAKADVDTFVTHAVNELGIEALKEKKYLIGENR